MMDKRYGVRVDGDTWWDAAHRDERRLTTFAEARAGFAAPRAFLRPDLDSDGMRQDGPEGLARAFCRYWQSRWVEAYIYDPETGPAAKAEIRRRQGSTQRAANDMMVRARLEEGLRSLVPGREFDPATALGRPLGFRLAAEMLGLDLDSALCHRAAEIVARQSAQHPAPEEKLPAYRAVQTLHQAVAERISAGEVAPNGVLHNFLRTEEARGLGRNYTVMSAVAILSGSTTLGSALANCLHAIHRSGEVPGAKDDRIGGLIEEALRLDPPTPYIHVVAHAAGTGAQELLHINVARANRDPAAFPDPDCVQPERRPRHFAYGGGPHACDGAPLARLALWIAIPSILRRLEGFEIRRTGPSTFAACFEGLAPSTMR